ncbi:hypothetical protein niasHS_003985 [Heterodera schachtii]|uniref:Uncharacterized protein n=1 Tax=Heterodera schachtii TaxID=97005 RepID=A0ABD2K3S5_HETSC
MSTKLLSDESFQKLLFDLFCVWNDVQRHYDPPITHSEEEKMVKVKQMICRLLGEIDGRVKRIQTMRRISTEDQVGFIEEWSLLTWNVLCITSRLQNDFNASVKSQEDRVIFNKLNLALVDLVNNSGEALSPPLLHPDANFDILTNSLAETMHILHGLYRTLKSNMHMTQEEVEQFAMRLQSFSDQNLIPFVEMFKSFCVGQTVRLWQDLRDVQIGCIVNKQTLPEQPVVRLVTFYSFQMHRLAILAARLQGFRYELTVNNRQMFGDYDPVRPLSDSVFSALELLMADCVLATEPSLNPILVTNNLFSINCGALARGVVFKQFDVQVVSEEMAEHIQSEMRRQRLLQQPSPIAQVPAAALLAMKPTSGTKRSNSQAITDASGNAQTAHKKSDINSKEVVTIYPMYNNKNRYWAASYPHLLCTTRQKGRQSNNNSYQDLSPNGMDMKSAGGGSSGKRPIFYFYIRATMFSPSGRFADAHTLSLPFTIATRRNQDYQVQRMMSSYTATCFWLYGNNIQDGLLLQWVETAMGWEKFKFLFMQHFRINAEVERGLQDKDFDLLQYKIQCNDCSPPSSTFSGDRKITFKNILCPHLRYECGSTNVRFSVWRGLLELLQLFQDTKTCVRKLWEKQLIMGFMEFDQVSDTLSSYPSALLMRLSFVTGGTICITLKSTVHSEDRAPSVPMHLEPLDLKKLQAKSLTDYLRDIAVAEKIKYLINSQGEPVLISDLLEQFSERTGGGIEELETSRCISSNVTHSGDIDAMQQITFTAMRIAVVTCKVKPPSADLMEYEEAALLRGDVQPKVHSPVPSSSNGYPSPSFNPASVFPGSAGGGGGGYRLPSVSAANDDFVREVTQLCNFWGKSKQELIELMEKAAEEQFATLSLVGGCSTGPPSRSHQNLFQRDGSVGPPTNGADANTCTIGPSLQVQQQQQLLGGLCPAAGLAMALMAGHGHQQHQHPQLHHQTSVDSNCNNNSSNGGGGLGLNEEDGPPRQKLSTGMIPGGILTVDDSPPHGQQFSAANSLNNRNSNGRMPLFKE